MKNLRKSQSGIVIMLAILVGVMVLGYVVISRVLKSDSAKEVQDRAGQVIETLDKTNKLTD